MKPKIFLTHVVVLALSIPILSSCEKEEVFTPALLTKCELNEKYLYDRYWLWVQMDTAVCRDLTMFHHDRIERVSVFVTDTVHKEQIDYQWLTECERFVKSDSDVGISYTIQRVNRRHLILAQYLDGQFQRYIDFIAE